VSGHRTLLIVDKVSAGEALRLRAGVASVKKGRPQSEVVVVVPSSAATLFRAGIEADRVIPSSLYDVVSSHVTRLRLKKVFELTRLVWRTGIGYDEVIMLGWGSTLLNVFGRVAGRRTIGFSHRWPWLLDVSLGYYDLASDLVEQATDTLRHAGIEPADDRTSVGVHSDLDELAIAELLASSNLASSSRLVVLHTGSDWACQQWQPVRWAELADALVQRHGAEIVFTGLAREREYVERTRAAMTSASVSFAGRTTLGQLAALLRRSSLCVTVDSAAYELAQAVGVPTVVLASPTLPVTLPALSQHRALVINKTLPDVREVITSCKLKHINGPIDFTNQCHDYGCPFAGMRYITVDQVLQAAEVQLA
jgi:ADP-heptose:LPS heptosyltransferase